MFEKYSKTPNSSSALMKDADGQLNVLCGPFKIEWSAQNWIYPRGYGMETQKLEIAATSISDISQLDARDERLVWISGENK